MRFRSIWNRDTHLAEGIPIQDAALQRRDHMVTIQIGGNFMGGIPRCNPRVAMLRRCLYCFQILRFLFPGSPLQQTLTAKRKAAPP